MNENDVTRRTFVEVFMRLTLDWERVTTFHLVGTAGSTPAEELMHRQNVYYVKEVLPKSQILNDPAAFVRDGLPDIFATGMTKIMVDTHREILDSAALIFAHSFLDGTLLECLRVCALADPRDFILSLKDRKISFSQAITMPLSALLAGAISDELGNIERQSMLFKVKRLFKSCRPTRTDFFTDGFRFDSSRLEALDKKRHEIVHSPSKRQRFQSIHEDLKFMHRSGLYIFLMLADRYGLRMSGDDFREALTNRLTPPAEDDFLAALRGKIESIDWQTSKPGTI